MAINSASCVDGSGEGTKATMPMHIWMHSVELTAIRHGASVAGVESAHAKLVLWFNAGEPVWIAADSLLQLARGYDRARREEADGFTHIRRAARITKDVHLVHGKTCEKKPHDNPGGGYLHSEDDDTPYNVDGWRYCGRCHQVLDV